MVNYTGATAFSILALKSADLMIHYIIEGKYVDAAVNAIISSAFIWATGFMGKKAIDATFLHANN